MKAQQRYVVWGSAVDQIRLGYGATGTDCAKDAFGLVSDNMSVSDPVNMTAVRSTVQRRRVLRDLLEKHQRRFTNNGRYPDIAPACAKALKDYP